MSANYFPLLGLQPALGRYFDPDEDRVPDRDRVVVLGHGFWRQWFASSPDALGAGVKINGTMFTVIGVARESFPGVMPVSNEIYIPAMMARVGYRFCKDAFASDCTVFSMIGRLRPASSVEQVQIEMETLMPASWSEAPEGENSGVTVYPARGTLDADRSRRSEFRFAALLVGVAGILLLVCCVNLAGLQVARNSARIREFGIRASLGAGPGRLTRQLVTESLVLALGGGVLGVFLSFLLGSLLHSAFYSIDAAGRPLYYNLTPELHVIATVLGVSIFAGFLIGIAPALKAGRTAANESLGKRASAYGAVPPVGRWFAGVQAGLAVPLVVVAGLLIASAHGILAGANFEPSHVALMRLRPRLIQYSPGKAQDYLRKVMRKLDAVPGVESASMVGNGVALLGGAGTVSLPGWTEDQAVETGRILIGPRYFETLKTSILQGREFDLHDDTRSTPVAVVNDALVRRFWKEGTVIGATVMVNQRPHQVVGVVSNVELQTRDHDAEAFVYTPFWQDPAMVDARLCVRVKGDPASTVASLAREVNQVDPDVPITETITLPLQLAGSTRALRITAAFVSYAAILAIALCAIGLYGALSFSVSRRTKEIGIRLAIGARPAEALVMVVREGMSVILVGVTLGVGLAVAATQVVRHLLYRSSSSDSMIYSTAVFVVLAASLVACWVPARRAASVEPLAALRDD